MAVVPGGPDDFSVPDEMRFKLREKEDYECAFCGVGNETHIDETGRGLHAHHVIPKAADGDHQLENLVLVCEDCHHALQHTQSRGLSQLKEWIDHLVREHLGEDIDEMAEDRSNFTFPGDESEFWYSFAQPRECPECEAVDLYRSNTVTAACPDCGAEFEPFETKTRVFNGYSKRKL